MGPQQPQQNPFIPPGLLPPPPPPSPALGFQTWASDQQNALKVQTSMVGPDAPLQPRASAMPPSGNPMASTMPPLPPVNPLSPPANVALAPATSYAQDLESNPDKYARPIVRGKGTAILNALVAGLTGAAGGLNNDPSAGVRYAMETRQHDEGIPAQNQALYESTVLNPYNAEVKRGQDQRIRDLQIKTLENPRDKFTPIQTSSGYAAFDPSKGTATPVLDAQGIQVMPGGKTAEPHYTTTSDGTVLAITIDAKGQPQTQVVYKGTPGLKTELINSEVSGKAHNILVNSQTGEMIKDLGARYERPNITNVNNAPAGSPQEEALVDQIGKGKMPAGRLSYLMARNPSLLAAVAEKYPDFDNSKIEAYANTYKEFTSTKTNSAGAALNAGGTALEHLKELRDLDTPESQIPHTPAWTAYQNKADTLATELARFYGDPTIPAIASIKKTLAANLSINRESAIRTQAQSMGRKLENYKQTWINAAPSAAYQAQMPDISESAKKARAELDPEYRKSITSQVSDIPSAGKKPDFTYVPGKGLVKN